MLMKQVTHYASVDMSRKTSSKKLPLPTLPSALKTSKELVLLLNVTSYSEITLKIENFNQAYKYSTRQLTNKMMSYSTSIHPHS